jgi:hypothetical protein
VGRNFEVVPLCDGNSASSLPDPDISECQRSSEGRPNSRGLAVTYLPAIPFSSFVFNLPPWMVLEDGILTGWHLC